MKCERVEISTEFIRLDQFLKFCGAVVTGGQAKEIIKSGDVTFNGEVCTERGRKLYPGSKVTLGGAEYEVTAGES